MMRWGVTSMAVVIAILANGVQPASSHSWYDGACCNEGDCYQTAQGEVQLGDGGWFIRSTGELIPFSDPRIKFSQDVFTHRCIFQVAQAHYFVNTIELGPMRIGDTRCLYIQGGM